MKRLWNRLAALMNKEVTIATIHFPDLDRRVREIVRDELICCRVIADRTDDV